MKRAGDVLRAGDSDVLRKLAEGPTLAQLKLMEAGEEIAENPPGLDDICYLHSVLCQCGLPRRRTEELTFRRDNGSSSLLITAGRLWNTRQRDWVQQPLPYGAKPRLILINLTSAAVTTGKRVIDVGRTMREFMERMGLDPQGSEYKSLKSQIYALAACRMQLGGSIGGREVNISTQPIKRLDVMVSRSPDQQLLWPGTVELSQDYFDAVVRDYAAIPLDERAVKGLMGSALGLDIYTWLVHRLCRIKEPNGVIVRWSALKDQFGQEYLHLKDFRKEFLSTLHKVVQVYPSAQLEELAESQGLILRQSPPPVPRRA